MKSKNLSCLIDRYDEAIKGMKTACLGRTSESLHKYIFYCTVTGHSFCFPFNFEVAAWTIMAPAAKKSLKTC